MVFFWTKTPQTIKKLLRNYIWDVPNTTNTIYLTFDDGPIPEVTEWVLDVLKEENSKATFFCIGDNIQKHPTIYQRILNEGHKTGNHTFNYLNGWKTKNKNYIENVKQCKTEHLKLNTEQSLLFRAPYGKITLSQSEKIQKLGYKIIMWDVLSYDFNTKITAEKCKENVLKYTSAGSIIVLHDSIKAEKTLKKILPEIIQEQKNKGFKFDVLP